MASSGELPVVDFSACAVGGEHDVDPASPAIQALADQIVEAMETIGFLYLVNHGIPASQIEDVYTVSKNFFGLPNDAKQCHARADDAESWHGWVVLEREGLNPERPGDYKEAFNISSLYEKSWPDDDVPGFREKTVKLYDSWQDLARRVMQLLGVGLKLENHKLFSDATDLYAPENASTVRLLHYPGMAPGQVLKPNQVRCGEHADYGTISMLLQDQIGGLEVRTREGVFVPATPREGSVVLNLGYLMERWTSDRLGATVHRVVLPESEDARRQDRYSMAFFCQPDPDFMVECIDGSNKYPPITSGDFLVEKFKEAYK